MGNKSYHYLYEGTIDICDTEQNLIDTEYFKVITSIVPRYDHFMSFIKQTFLFPEYLDSTKYDITISYHSSKVIKYEDPFMGR